MSPEFGVRSSEYGNKFSFEDLLVYRKALDHVDYVYELTQKFPKEEKFGLSQYLSISTKLKLGLSKLPF
jgi:hypothetical protein